MFFLGIHRSLNEVAIALLAETGKPDEIIVLATYRGGASLKKMGQAAIDWRRSGGILHDLPGTKFVDSTNLRGKFEFAMPEDMVYELDRLNRMRMHPIEEQYEPNKVTVTYATAEDLVPRKEIPQALCMLSQAIADGDLIERTDGEIGKRLEMVDIKNAKDIGSGDNLVIAAALALKKIREERDYKGGSAEEIDW